MQKDDIAFVQEIARSSWHYTYADIIAHAIQDHFLAIEQLIKRLANSPFLVAVLHESLVGFAHFSNVINGEAELFAMYLHPTMQSYPHYLFV
ncbi:hypothetical protein MHB42_11190 [Lysinibacillus sp. FSL K6-0232]